MEGTTIIGVQFRRAGRIYDFASGPLDLKVGEDVVVDTDRGPSLAKVAAIRFMLAGDPPGKDLRPILRSASERDLEEARKLTPESATAFARDRAERLGLSMTVLQSEVQFGGNKVIIYFSAPGRVDFRELVKDLATGLRARVELKQVGARDEAKLVGGIGICGREFCCSSFLREFVPVSIKMAKNQNLALNPSKVSGGCGRLLCCLTYENDLYSELRSLLPPRGTRVRHRDEPEISGSVLKGDILNQVVVIETADGRQATLPVSVLEVVEPGSNKGEEDEGADGWGEDLDLQALTALEDESKGRGDGAKAPGERPSSGRPPRGGTHPSGSGKGGPRGPGGRPSGGHDPSGPAGAGPKGRGPRPPKGR